MNGLGAGLSAVSGMAGSALLSVSYAKAKLVVADSIPALRSQEIDCWFNPERISMSVSVDVRPTALLSGVDSTPAASPNPASWSFELLLWRDAVGIGTSIPEVVDDLRLLTAPINPTGRARRLPRMSLQWGSLETPKAVIESMSVEYQRFNPTGEPIQARIHIGFVEADPPKSQNPGSTATVELRRVVVAPGDTLPLIAFQHFQDATRWREVAEFNDIDDPLRLAPGTTIYLPGQGA